MKGKGYESLFSFNQWHVGGYRGVDRNVSTTLRHPFGEFSVA
jgi:hypothetical protein